MCTSCLSFIGTLYKPCVPYLSHCQLSHLSVIMGRLLFAATRTFQQLDILRITPTRRLLFSNHSNQAVLFTNSHQMEATQPNDDAASAENIVKERTCVTQLPEGVFYNPVQQFNRDISIAVIEQFALDHHRRWQEIQEKKKNRIKPAWNYSGITILEALAASGLRSMRMSRELSAVLPPGVLKGVLANDVDPTAVELIRENAKRNNVEHLVTASCEDAILLMVRHACNNQRFEVIDLDPYGTASRFLDPALQAIADGGLLCVTCTDAAVLCGSAQGTSWGKYGSLALSRCPATHEMALRVLLHAIQSAAGRHGKYIQPLISLSIDFYVRVFVRVVESPLKVKFSAQTEALLVDCVDCKTFALQPMCEVTCHSATSQKSQAPRWTGLQSTVFPVDENVGRGVCPHCDGALRFGGPMWSGPLHDRDFVSSILARLQPMLEAQKKGTNPEVAPPLPPFGTLARMVGMLQVVQEELEDIPLYYLTDKLAASLHAPTPSFVQLRSALMHAGYRVSLSHCEAASLKTNAPAGVVWRVMRAWTRFVSERDQRQYPSDAHLQEEKSVAKRILKTYDTVAANEGDTRLVVRFDPHPQVQPASRAAGLHRFAPNPEKNWGPKPRAKKRPPSPTDKNGSSVS